VRAEVETLTLFPKEPGEMTLAEAAKWNNKLRALAPFEEDESRLVQEQFLRMVSAIGEREGIMPGLTAYIVDELAFTLRIRPKEET
jgi:hypothetical protein